MKSVSGKEFAKVLERNGWANRSLKTGLLKHLLKMARLSEDAL